MRPPLILALFSLALILGGCSTMTSGMRYAPRDKVTKLGYSETRLSADQWSVSFYGYSIPPYQARDYALLRAAEVCLANGYTHYAVAGENSSQSTAAGMAFGVGPNAAILAYAQSPEATVTIRALKSGANGAYDAALLVGEIRKKYGL